MKKFAFVSDFDGTLTTKDFYHIIIENYLKEDGKKFYKEWKKENKINVEFLNKIFGSIDIKESDLQNDIINIPIDKNAKELIELVNINKGDFYVVSAGTSYYINILFEYLDIKDVKVISMEGKYEGKNLKITPNKNSKFFSEIFGIDKGKILREIKEQYEYVFFAGDSEPDLEAAKVADTTFAKKELKELLEKEKAEFVAFDTFAEIINYMNEKGWFNEV
ncbi:MAG: MtnX-like HAD-IB family phosphatase [Eubacteriales bacterium]